MNKNKAVAYYPVDWFLVLDDVPKKHHNREIDKFFNAVIKKQFNDDDLKPWITISKNQRLPKAVNK